MYGEVQTKPLLAFGKHKGRQIDQVDDRYLLWMCESFSKTSQWQKAAASVLTVRGKATQQEAEHLQSLLTDLKSCSLRRELDWGKKLHARAAENGSDTNMYVATALIKMYANCHSMPDAYRVFDKMQKPDAVSWSSLLLGYAENGEGNSCLKLFSRMKADGCVPSAVTYIAVFKACTSLAVNGDESAKARALEVGSRIHSETGCHLDLYVQSTLVDMYSKCGSMENARQVFDSIQKPNVVSWNALLSGYAENGEGQVSLKLFLRMKAAGCAPNSVTFVAVLKACTSLAMKGNKVQGLEVGSRIHVEIGEHLNPFVQSTLIDMYAKCGSMAEAHQVFNSIQKPDLVSWTALLSGYAENGEGHAALELLFKMKAAGCVPNSVTYVAALKACTSLAVNGDGLMKANALETGRGIHAEIGDNLNSHLQSALIDMYAKCGSMMNARQVFDSLQKPDVISWTALLLGYAENGQGHVSLELFSKMKADRCPPNSVTYFAALKACSSIGALTIGRKIHSEVGEFTVQVVACLVDFYAKCGSMEEAREVFDLHPQARDMTAWNALLLGYSGCGDTASVFKLFEALQDTGLQPNGITFLCILLCCNHAGLVSKARQYLEAMPVQYGVTPDVFHYNCMVDVLGRANQLMEALVVLRRMPCNPTAVTWRALLGGCRKWKNVGAGRMAFQSLVELDNKDASSYLLMGHIYGSLGMWDEQAKVLESRSRFGAWELPRNLVLELPGPGTAAAS